MDKYMQTIRNIIKTLNGVSAKEPENWERLLASHQALVDMLESMQREAAKAADTKAEV